MDKEVSDYFDKVPEVRKPVVTALHEAIMGAFPEATVDMKYRMPTYWHGAGWVALANQKNYVSLYTCGYHHIRDFKEKHPRIITGKGCINFKETDSIPIEDIRNVVRHAMLHPKED